MFYTAQSMIDKMLEAQLDPKEGGRIRPFYTGLASDWWANIDAGADNRDNSPSRFSRFVSSVGAALHILR